MTTTLLPNHWYMSKSCYGDIHILYSSVAADSSVDWQEISPPTITPIAKDLSQAKVGDVVTDTANTKWCRYLVVHIGSDYVLLKEANYTEDDYSKAYFRTVSQSTYSNYTLLP